MEEAKIVTKQKSLPLYSLYGALKDDIENPARPSVFAYRDISVVTRHRSNKKQLLHSTTGHLEAGDLCALMGASGAGKSTLLGALSKTSRHDVKGSLLWNGNVVTLDWMRTHTLHVPTHDALFGCLTVYQTLKFYAKNFGKGVQDVMAVLQELQIEQCIHQKLNKLSTGQQKRVSLAVALLRECNMLFLDEPTSGLSDSDALVLMGTLRQLSQKGILIVCVLHAPRYDIFHMLTRLILVSAGQVVCNGKQSDIAKCFEELGHPCPNDFVLATHLVDVCCCIHESTADSTPQAVAARTGMHWQKHFNPSVAGVQGPLPVTPEGSSFSTQCAEIFKRDVRLAVQNGTHYVVHWLLLLSVVLILGLVFGKTSPHGEHFKLRAEMLYCFSPVNVFFIVAFKNDEMPVVKQTFVKENHYRIISPLSFHLAHGWSDVLYYWFAAITITVCLRKLIELEMDFDHVAYHALMTFFAIRFTTAIRWILCLFMKRPDIAMFMSCFAELLMEGFNGVFVGPDDIIPELAWGCYLNPMYYVYQGVFYNQNDEYGLPFDDWDLSSVVYFLIGVVVLMNTVVLMGLYYNHSYVI